MPMASDAIKNDPEYPDLQFKNTKKVIQLPISGNDNRAMNASLNLD
jgi:hypothetical protein